MGDIRFERPLSHDLARSLIGRAYTVTTTSGAVVCKGPRGTPAVIFSPGGLLARKTLNLMVRTRSHIKGRLDKIRYHKDGPPPACQYIPPEFVAELKKRPGCRAIELDLSAAWWTAARNLGAIDKDFYRIVLRTAKKDARLRAIGALATVRTKQSFVDGAPTGDPEHGYSDENLARVFRSIVIEANIAIKKLAVTAGDDFLFFWADALFIRPDDATRKAVERQAEAMGYGIHGNAKIYSLSIEKNPYMPDSPMPVVTVRYRKEPPRHFFMPAESDGREPDGTMSVYRQED